MKHYIFDVDGTLTPSRGVIDPTFKKWFLDFCSKNNVYLVAGSDKPKTVEQIGSEIYNKCKKVYQCSGSEVYIGDDVCYVTTWTVPDDARQWLLNALEDSDFDIRTGNHIEQRVGMVNFSVVGRNDNQQERKAYVDYEAWNGERRFIADLFNADFPHLEATVGGETGIDIAPKGSDKSQILRDFDKYDEIYFFGDAIFDGGNDYPLASALTNFNTISTSYRVENWKDTFNKLKGLNMNYEELIGQWHRDRNLIDGATDKDQYMKLIQEAGELSDNICKGKDIRDDIGDMMVVLINIMVRNGLTMEECLAVAYDDIKDRKGKMIDGVFVKESDLQ